MKPSHNFNTIELMIESPTLVVIRASKKVANPAYELVLVCAVSTRKRRGEIEGVGRVVTHKLTAFEHFSKGQTDQI